MPRERRSKYANDAKDTVGIASQVESLSSTVAQLATKSPLYYLDAYNAFFGGSANDFVTGQSVDATTTTAQASVGSNVIAVSSVTGLSAGVVLVVNAGTSDQQLVSVLSVAGNNVTVSPTLKAAVANGANVAPLWVNASHLTTLGLTAFGYWFVNAKDSKGNNILKGNSPKITLFGDSWIAQNPPVLESTIKSLIPNATVVNAGVSGNTSTMMLARFDTDVPTDSDYVIFNEPGVNDVYQSFSPTLIASNLETIVSKIRAIGAIPIFTGMVPLSDYLVPAKTRATELSLQIGDGLSFPAVSSSATIRPVQPEVDSLGIGEGTLKTSTTGTNNTAIGAKALDAITSGSSNTVIGRESGTAMTIANNNVAIGVNTLRANVSGGDNTAIGQASLSATTNSNNTAIGSLAGLLVSSGSGNTHIGKGAGYQSGGDVATDATTTASYQTAIGYQAGGGATNNYGTAIGYRSKASGFGATAIGAGATASGAGSVAIGRDSNGNGATTTTNNEIAIGTSTHTVKIAGKLNVAQATPTSSSDIQGQVGDIATDDNYIYVKTSSGWKRSALSTW
jgi:hypothetical protein